MSRNDHAHNKIEETLRLKPETTWRKIEQWESDKGTVVLVDGEWRGWVKLKDKHRVTFEGTESTTTPIPVTKLFKLSGEGGSTYASADAAKAAVERTWLKHGGVYGKK